MSGQFDLFGDKPRRQSRKRSAYQQTSREAFEPYRAEVQADRIEPRTLDFDIALALYAAGPEGMICEAIEIKIDRSHQAVSGNLRHLVERGFVRHNGQKGKTSRNRSAMKWALTKLGQIQVNGS